MKVYIVDSFTEKRFSGNQAGVVLLEGQEDFPKGDFMRRLAAELRYSETAFVKKVEQDTFKIKYFTPMQEVALCGHATVAAFTVLYQEKVIEAGRCQAQTMAGNLEVEVSEKAVWMEMAAPKTIKIFTPEESAALYASLALGTNDASEGLLPQIINTGLSDIMLPVKNQAALKAAVLDVQKVSRLSRACAVTGIHLFCLETAPNLTARCRNFAPACGIDEESATGTSNGALTWYLRQYGIIQSNKINTFIQGEAMGKPSVIKTVFEEKAGKPRIRVGGAAVIVLKGALV
ncbi:PhzF family phenazine biosynthesis protein [Eubacterium sp. 1001713B170207_170306_E7]|uniref:PhzF family phenazine biosynthesis protein n=1 Tax=Eubacterium sp. 1001713B170207_170306_E7 TaxID=2787097 RepID=UPI0018980773|nr:PhzF family phenazine biosynthesis protein [Eubacterium sp. 1001713B170207_170306_E7]